MSNETYKMLDQYFKKFEVDARNEVLELAKILASRIAAKAVKIHGDSNGILDTKDLVWYLRMETEAEIHNTLIDIIFS